MMPRVFHRHARWVQLADAYIDGELAPGELARFEKHLAGCDRCQAAVDAARSTKTLLAAAPPLAAPRSFALTPQMVGGAVNAPTRVRPVALRLAQAATALAVVAFATVVTLDVTSGGGSSGPQPLAASEQATGGKVATDSLAPTIRSAATSPAPSPTPTALPTSVPIAPPPTDGAGAQGFSPSPSPSPTPSPSATAQPATTNEAPSITSEPVVPATGPNFGAHDTSGGAQTTGAHTAPRESGVTTGWYRPAEIALAAAAFIAAAFALVLAIRRRRV